MNEKKLTEKEITILRKELENTLKRYKGKEHIKLNIDPSTLNQIIFNDYYKEINGLVPKLPAFDFNLIKKLDLTGVSFDNVVLEGLNFTGSYGVVINPQTVWEKDFTGGKLANVTFEGSFDGCFIECTSFKGSHGARINPETIAYKNLFGAVLADAQFIGSFDGCCIERANFAGSKGAIIIPTKISDKNFKYCILNDVTFTSSHKYGRSGDMFKDCQIEGANFKGSHGANIDPQLVYDKNLKNTVLANVSFKDTYLQVHHNFEGASISGANFKGSYGAKIYPQVVRDRDFRKCTLTNVTIYAPFTGWSNISEVNFNDCFIAGTNFTGSIGAIINPQKVANRDLSKTRLANTLLSGSFNGCNIKGTNFTDSKGAKIDPQKVIDKNLSGVVLTDATIIGRFDGCNTNGTDFTGAKGIKEEFNQIKNGNTEIKNISENEPDISFLSKEATDAFKCIKKVLKK